MGGKQNLQGESCAKRIKRELKDRMAWIGEAVEEQEKREELLAQVLECERSFLYTVMLSTGGPEDGFRFFVDPSTRQITRAFYWFSDWFDSAELEVEGKSFEILCNAFAWVAET